MVRISVQKSSQLFFSDAVDNFFDSRIQKNCSPETIHFYKNIVKEFRKFSQEENLENIDERLISDFHHYLRNKDLQPESIVTYMRGIRAVMYYFMDRGYIEKFRITVPHSNSKFKKIYTDEELSQLLKKPNMKTCSFSEYRTWVIVNYVMGTGQRLSTIINIRNEDIDLHNELVHLRHLKNRQEDILPLTKSLIPILKEYMHIRKGAPGDYLFSTDHGEQMTKSAMTTSIARYNKKRGVNKTSLHLFRHTFAVLWVRESGDIAKLQRMLTHSDLSTTQKYLGMTCEDIRKNMDLNNPLEKFAANSQIKIK